MLSTLNHRDGFHWIWIWIIQEHSLSQQEGIYGDDDTGFGKVWQKPFLACVFQVKSPQISDLLWLWLRLNYPQLNQSLLFIIFMFSFLCLQSVFVCDCVNCLRIGLKSHETLCSGALNSSLFYKYCSSFSHEKLLNPLLLRKENQSFLQ